MAKKKVLVFVTQILETGGIESHLKEFCLQFKNSNNLSISILILNSKASIQTHQFYNDVFENVWIISNQNVLIRYLKLLFLIPILNFKNFETLYSNGQGNSILYFKKLLFSIKNWVHHHHTSGEIQDRNTWTNSYTKTLLNANTIVACANYNATLISQALERKVISIPCFSRAITIENKAINPQKIKLAYIGRLIKEKGIETICKISKLEELKHIEFVIWGEGSLYTESYFKSFPNVKYKGSFKNKQELTNALNNIDAFILYSSHPEGLPISLLEIMSAGLPWIATKTGGISELCIDNNLNYLLPQNTNFDELVEHLKIFSNHLISLPNIATKQIAAYNKTYASAVVKQSWMRVL
ncbi:MAG: glycosyltransferase family 4 protein [Bacteroidia bacterium]